MQWERQQRQQALAAKRALQAERVALSAAAAASLRERPDDGSITPLQRQPANDSGTPSHHEPQGEAQQQQGDAGTVAGRASHASPQALAGTASTVVAQAAVGATGGDKALLQHQQADGGAAVGSAATAAAINQPASAQRQQAAASSMVAAEASQQRSEFTGSNPGTNSAEFALLSARLATARSAAGQPASLGEQLQTGGTAVNTIPSPQRQQGIGFAAAAVVTGLGQPAGGGAASNGAQADPGSCAEAGPAHSMPTITPAPLQQGKGQEQPAAQQQQPTPASISSPGTCLPRDHWKQKLESGLCENENIPGIFCIKYLFQLAVVRVHIARLITITVI